MQIQPLPQQTPYRPALRLIDTKSITHDDQLAVTGKQAADVAVLMHGQNLQIHRIER